jgi:inosine-uridine nucleoside N-ribohydrolase
MKILPFLFLIILAYSCGSPKADEATQIPRILFDTDLGPDYDDVGALAILNAMADSGKAEILATVSSNKYELVVPCIEIINTYFGRPGLRTGSPKSAGANMSAFQHWPDSLVKKYPHSIKSTSDAPDAVSVYRKILAEQPDNSVTFVTVGFLTNAANLLKSQPDSISPLSGEELISRKIKLFVSMAGHFPEGREFNIWCDSVSSEYVFNEWPGEIIFTGWEIGAELFTGLRLIATETENSPVKDVFRISIPMSEEDKPGRKSWDETAVLIAVYGPGKFFNTVKGNILVNPDGSNGWEDDPEGKHSYVTWKMDKKELERFIEDRMMHLPLNKK